MEDLPFAAVEHVENVPNHLLAPLLPPRLHHFLAGVTAYLQQVAQGNAHCNVRAYLAFKVSNRNGLAAIQW